LDLFGININVIPSNNSSFLSKASPLRQNMLLIKLIKTSLDTTLLIIHHQQHVSAL